VEKVADGAPVAARGVSLAVLHSGQHMELR
jgi:hypothetical protein